jgi:hypothetical protein
VSPSAHTRQSTYLLDRHGEWMTRLTADTAKAAGVLETMEHLRSANEVLELCLGLMKSEGRHRRFIRKTMSFSVKGRDGETTNNRLTQFDSPHTQDIPAAILFEETKIIIRMIRLRVGPREPLYCDFRSNAIATCILPRRVCLISSFSHPDR